MLMPGVLQSLGKPINREEKKLIAVCARREYKNVNEVSHYCNYKIYSLPVKKAGSWI